MLLGITVTAGVLTSMVIAGFIFIILIGGSLSVVTGLIAPILFLLLMCAGILMVVGIDFGRYIRAIRPPRARGPLSGAFLFGAFFGLAALPCNPAPIIVLFAISSTVGDIFLNFLVLSYSELAWHCLSSFSLHSLGTEWNIHPFSGSDSTADQSGSRDYDHSDFDLLPRYHHHDTGSPLKGRKIPSLPSHPL